MNCVECKHRRPMGKLMGCGVKKQIIVDPEADKDCCEKGFYLMTLLNKVVRNGNTDAR